MRITPSSIHAKIVCNAKFNGISTLRTIVLHATPAIPFRAEPCYICAICVMFEYSFSCYVVGLEL